MGFAESEKTELKSSFGEWKDIICTLAAFANKNGGTVIVGVDDSGQPLGTTFGKGAIRDKEIEIAEIYKQARSVPRNKLIMRIFHEYGLIENWGTGFQRMRELCRSNGNPDPVFSDRSQAFVITFRKLEKSSEKSSEKILRLIFENTTISAKEIAEIIGISSRAVEKSLDKLKQEGRLERVGPDKGGYWKISIK